MMPHFGVKITQKRLKFKEKWATNSLCVFSSRRFCVVRPKLAAPKKIDFKKKSQKFFRLEFRLGGLKLCRFLFDRVLLQHPLELGQQQDEVRVGHESVVSGLPVNDVDVVRHQPLHQQQARLVRDVFVLNNNGPQSRKSEQNVLPKSPHIFFLNPNTPSDSSLQGTTDEKSGPG